MAFACDSCAKTFTARYLLNRHLVIHTRVRNYLCPVCGEAFLQSCALNRHSASHEDRLSYRCDECGKRFNRSSTRDVHQASHAEKTHVCERCGKAFHQKSTLKTHELIHTETRPFECCHCDKKFRQRSNLRVHILRCHRGLSEMLGNNNSDVGRNNLSMEDCTNSGKHNNRGGKKEEDFLDVNKLRKVVRKEDCGKQTDLVSGKKEDLFHRKKFRQYVRKENCMNRQKEIDLECGKEQNPFHNEVHEADVVDKNNPVSCSKVKCDLNKSKCINETEISSLPQRKTSLPSNNSLRTLQKSRRNHSNSATVATENNPSSDSDVENDELETEEDPIPIHSTSARFKSNDSELCPNVGDESHSENTSLRPLSCTQRLEIINERSRAFPDSDVSCKQRIRLIEKSAAVQKIADKIDSTSGNEAEEVSRKTVTNVVFDSSVPALKCLLPVQPLAGGVGIRQMKSTESGRDDKTIPPISDTLPISLSVQAHSDINIYTNHSPVDANHLLVDAIQSTVHANHSAIVVNHLPAHANHSLVDANHSPIDTNHSAVDANHSAIHTNHSPAHTSNSTVHANHSPNDSNHSANHSPIPTNSSPIHTNHSAIHANHSAVHTNSALVNKSVLKPEEPPPNIENFLADVFKSCRLATSLLNHHQWTPGHPRSTAQSTAVTPKHKVTPSGRIGPFSGSKTPTAKHLRAKGLTMKKSEKLMYVKLFTPDKPVTEFIWSCGMN